MPSNINNFRASFKNYIAHSSRFDVSISVPLTLIQYRNTAQQLTYRCEHAELPGRTFATIDQKIYGPTEKHPYLSEYNSMNMSFIVSDDMSEKQFFDAWMELINPTTNYNFKYKGDYSTVVTVNQYDHTGDLSYSVDLVEAFPISINQMDLDWSSTNHHKLTVVMAYTSWRNNTVQNVLNQAVDAVVGVGLSKIESHFGLSGLGGNIIR